MKLLFVIYRLDFADHIAISYLSAIAKQLGWSTYFIYLVGDGSSNLTEKIKEIRPDVVAYSVNILGYKKIVEEHKKAIKECELIGHKFISIMGGPHATFSPETFEESTMDVFCIGEGEYVLRDFLIAIENGNPFDNIPNIIARDKDGNVKVNPVRHLIENLDELPIADRDLTISNSYLKDTPRKTFYATRGCPFSCNYCNNNYYNLLYKGKGTIVRRFSVERIIREIEDVKSKYRTEFIKFGDDLFAMKADEWLEEFAEKYSKRIGIPFNCYLRFDIVNEDMLKLLKKAGCYSVDLSVDSVSENVRENILGRKMRRLSKDGIIYQLRLIRKYGINTLVNFMLAAPESTLQNDLDTIKMARKADVTYLNYSTTTAMKGSRLYYYCIDHKLIDPATNKGDMTGNFEKSTFTCFSEKEKNIRYNVFLLGHVASKLPVPFYNLMMWVIKNIPTNRLFRKIRDHYYYYNITHTIFKITD